MPESYTPASDPMRGPNRLTIPRLGLRAELPHGLPPTVVEPATVEIKVDPPSPGDKFSVPRLGMYGVFGSLDELEKNTPDCNPGSVG